VGALSIHDHQSVRQDFEGDKGAGSPVKPAPQKPKTALRNALFAVIAIQLAFNCFVLYRLQHQEAMNREQVRFDVTVSKKVFGQDFSVTTNIVRVR
jgi:hypothetical protein